MRKTGAVAGIVGAVAATLMLGSGTASAANPTNYCSNATECYLSINNFGGGTLAIDADAIGGVNEAVGWYVGGLNCSASTTVNAPAQSWVCHNQPGGSYQLRIYGANGNRHNFSLGARY
ncbi:hypothetical protein [Amycolatopsis magusensis]|uniref:Peptidase inhibitor family I36 n=1 Tax=Amycolatopsis magusensis TaxID=882444 RepID=A0ABS4PTP0_9PSEU|nr:hypothetical protein [Amycolatopsis magusensis]MBP2182800.1 hypothetical protein [Amycolatopsis magusensis]MDI5982182.1 hypothetical protein [Amycolatopsis magusensis]